ncbi:MAG: SlyX family protein [Planctomycetota bacterium]|nr:SlyX family protein [Planctomycetota bacterium]
MSGEDDRLIDLEERYMHLEKLVDQLNAIVTEQQTEIEALTRQLKVLQEEVQSAPDENTGEEPPPPHY